MDDAQHIWAAGLSFELVAAVGSIGWILGIACLFVKFDRKKDSKICLVSDLVGKTFVAITFVGVLMLTIEFAIYLQRGQTAQTGAPDWVSTVLDGQSNIMTEIVNLPAPEPESIAQIIDNIVQRDGRISDARLTEVVRNGLGPASTDSLVFRTTGQGVEVRCVNFGDGKGLECSRSKG